ncbi:hypothetical protein, partial [Streptomyces lushanensis]|uniref:hypothetical protein n=1 Tax=Streptomyces lushanensis TaxID=1434255 RepID=UPI001B805C69
MSSEVAGWCGACPGPDLIGPGARTAPPGYFGGHVSKNDQTQEQIQQALAQACITVTGGSVA